MTAANGQDATMSVPGAKNGHALPGREGAYPVSVRLNVRSRCYDVVTEVSSTKKYVLSEESSTPKKRSVTVLPLNEDRSSVFST